MSHVIPRQPAPPLFVPTLDHGHFGPAVNQPDRFMLIKNDYPARCET